MARKISAVLLSAAIVVFSPGLGLWPACAGDVRGESPEVPENNPADAAPPPSALPPGELPALGPSAVSGADALLRADAAPPDRDLESDEPEDAEPSGASDNPGGAGSPEARSEAPRGSSRRRRGNGFQGRDAQGRLDALFDGRSPSGRSSGFIVNDDGALLTGRAQAYHLEAARLVQKYRGRIDFSESVDVMEESYRGVAAKLAVLEYESKGRKPVKLNTHLEKTLTWVDGVLKDGGDNVAVNTYSVFFHRAKSRESEVREGIRRADHYLEEMFDYFAPGGRASRRLGRVDSVVLGFDTRGYPEIKTYLKEKYARLPPRLQQMYRFDFLDEIPGIQIPKTKAEVVAQYNDLVRRHPGMGYNMMGAIIEGVIYSRHTGLLLELKTAEAKYEAGYSILSAGHELFDKDGHYVTELDVVAKSPKGVVELIEAKSARVPLPLGVVLNDKVLYKLRAYKKNRALIERYLGAPLNVVFSLDVGDLDQEPATRAQERYLRRQESLVQFLKSREEPLSREFGFPVRFMFIHSAPPSQDRLY